MLTALNDELCDPQRFAAALLKPMSGSKCRDHAIDVIRSDSLRPY